MGNPPNVAAASQPAKTIGKTKKCVFFQFFRTSEKLLYFKKYIQPNENNPNTNKNTYKLKIHVPDELSTVTLTSEK
ncbi:hypothetical protein LFREDSHE_25050 [Shewanella baltica]